MVHDGSSTNFRCWTRSPDSSAGSALPSDLAVLGSIPAGGGAFFYERLGAMEPGLRLKRSRHQQESYTDKNVFSSLHWFRVQTHSRSTGPGCRNE